MPKRDEISRRLHPRLRCIRNGAAPVNLLRSGITSTVASAPGLSAVALGLPANLDMAVFAESAPVATASSRSRRTRFPKREPIEQALPPDRSSVNVFVELHHDRGIDGGEATRSAVDRIANLARDGATAANLASCNSLGTDVLVRRNLVSATVPISVLSQLEQDPEVAFVHPSEPLVLHQPAVNRALNSAPKPRSVGNAALRKTHGDGAGVLIGIVDVGGFDFAHPDFRDAAGGTRFLSIWDQGGDFRPPPSVLVEPPFELVLEELQHARDVVLVDMGDIGRVDPVPGLAKPCELVSDVPLHARCHAAVAKDAPASIAFKQKAVSLVRLEDPELHATSPTSTRWVKVLASSTAPTGSMPPNPASLRHS